MKKILIIINTIIVAVISSSNTHAQIVTEFANTSLGFRTTTNVIAPAPEAAFLADLDGDGDPDAVIANGNFNSGFSVLLNDGNGNFGTPAQYTTGFESWDIVVADFTGDNIPDVIVSNRGATFNGTSVSLFPGNGNGTFGTKTNYSVGIGPVGLTAADFNADGYMDLAVANNGGFGSGTTVSILMNNTSGGFNASLTVPAGTAPYKIAAGLIDGDSLPDIVVANEQEEITVLHNTGSGFTNTTYSMQSTQFNNLFASVQLSDIDNDGDLDVFYSSQGTQDISLRRNLGNGALDTIEMITLDFLYGGASSFKVTDFNGDGFKDIVASVASGSTGDGYRVVLNQFLSPDRCANPVSVIYSANRLFKMQIVYLHSLPPLPRGLCSKQSYNHCINRKSPTLKSPHTSLLHLTVAHPPFSLILFIKFSPQRIINKYFFINKNSQKKFAPALAL
jgi:hypothetical protein